MLSATRRKWSASSFWLGLMKYGVITETPAAPSRSAIFVSRLTSRVVSAPVPRTPASGCRRGPRVRDDGVLLALGERVELAGCAQHEDAMHAASEHEVNVLSQGGQVEFLIRGERRDNRWDDAAKARWETPRGWRLLYQSSRPRARNRGGIATPKESPGLRDTFITVSSSLFFSRVGMDCYNPAGGHSRR